jgi:hypothetical protein
MNIHANQRIWRAASVSALAASLLAIHLFVTVGNTHSEIIDRIVAVVDGRIVTHSDLRQEKRLKAVLGEAPAEESAILQSVIEHILIEDQMVQFPGVEVTMEEIDAEFRRIRNYEGLSQEVIRRGIQARIARGRFFDLRFRQFIQASNEEIQQYYDTVFVPEARARGLASIPSLQDTADLLSANVINEKLVREIDAWLDTLRGRSIIEVFQ